MKRTVLVGAALLLATACEERGEDSGTARVATPAATASASAPGAPAATPTAAASEGTTSSGARSVSEETDDFVFDYSYPAEAGDIPPLATLLDRRLERARASLAQQAAAAREAARDNGFPYNKYSSGMAWKTVADLPDWLSLSGEMTEYTGGAHGNYGVQSLVWDKRAGRAMSAIDLFNSPEALGEALGERYCEALDKLRAEKGTEPAEEGQSVFPACPGVEELIVLVGSSNGRTFNRLTLYAGPYVAGSYAEGAYEVHLDVDRAVLDAVKPEHRASFSARG
jgi:hypothetical protein